MFRSDNKSLVWMAILVFLSVTPLWADDICIDGDNCDASFESSNAVYLTARDADSAACATDGTSNYCGQRLTQASHGLYRVWRLGFKFDASEIFDDAIIDSCKLRLVGVEDRNDSNSVFDFCVMHASFDCPLNGQEWDEWDSTDAHIGGSLAESSIVVGGNWITIDSLDWISKTGATYLALVTSDDIDKTAPTKPTNYDAWAFYMADDLHEPARSPVLKIWYHTEGRRKKIIRLLGD